MPGSTRRQRELARLKWERRQRQMAETKGRKRRRQKIIAAALSVVLVVGLGFWVATLIADDEETPPADAADGSVFCDYRTVEGVDTGGKTVTPPPTTAPTTGTYQATITTSQGVVEMDLDAAAAPCTVNSFVQLANSGFFDATKCHRLLTGEAGNVLQCGDPTGTGSGGPGYQFDDENLTGATYTSGTVAMANSGANTNGSQFFMVYGDSAFPPNYTPFGRITSGLDILEAIAAGGVTGESNDVPKTEVQVESVTITVL